MKFLIASDLHGSAYYCKKLTEIFRAEKADKLVLLGDLLYHGPRNVLPREYDPKGVADMLNEIAENIIAVKGNCDSDVDQYVLKFPIKAEYAYLYIADKLFVLTHGDKYAPSQLVTNANDGIYVCGHTHVFGMEYENGILCLNPGSLSLPKNDSPSGYFVLDEYELTYKTIDGEIIKSISLGDKK